MLCPDFTLIELINDCRQFKDLPPIVQLIHQTVREFLVDNRLYATPLHLENQLADTEILASCCRYICFVMPLPELRSLATEKNYLDMYEVSKCLRKRSLLGYCGSYLHDHMDYLKKHNVSLPPEYTKFAKLAGLVPGSWGHLLYQQLAMRRRPYNTNIQALYNFNIAMLQHEAVGFLATLNVILTCETSHTNDGDMGVALHGRTWHDTAARWLYLAERSGYTGRDVIRRLRSRHEAYVELYAVEDSEDIVTTATPSGPYHVARHGVFSHALEAAAYIGNDFVVQELLNFRVEDVLAEGKYGTALEAAARRGRLSTLGILLDRGSKINTKGGKYGTALHAAIQHGDREVVDFLLGKGANPNVRDLHGANAVEFAKSLGRDDLVPILEEAQKSAPEDDDSDIGYCEADIGDGIAGDELTDGVVTGSHEGA